MKINIEFLDYRYIDILYEAFAKNNWHKPKSLFEKYLDKQKDGTRKILVATVNSEITGYATLNFESQYKPFQEENIPEIQDLNVLPAFRNKGIASSLLDSLENQAKFYSDGVGIGVGLYAGDDGGYGAAQKLYVKRGYIPDGKGVTYNYEPVIPGNSYTVDDDLILWFTKSINSI